MKLDAKNARLLRAIYRKLIRDHRRYGLLKLLADEFGICERHARRIINSACPHVRRETYEVNHE